MGYPQVNQLAVAHLVNETAEFIRDLVVPLRRPEEVAAVVAAIELRTLQGLYRKVTHAVQW